MSAGSNRWFFSRKVAIIHPLRLIPTAVKPHEEEEATSKHGGDPHPFVFLNLSTLKRLLRFLFHAIFELTRYSDSSGTDTTWHQRVKHEGGVESGSDPERASGLPVLVRRLEPQWDAAGLLRGRQGHPDMGTRGWVLRLSCTIFTWVVLLIKR